MWLPYSFRGLWLEIYPHSDHYVFFSCYSQVFLSLMFINFVMLGLAWVSLGLPWLWFADLLLNFYGIWEMFSLYFLKLLPCSFTSQTTATQRHLKHTTDLKLSSGEILTTEAHVAFPFPCCLPSWPCMGSSCRNSVSEQGEWSPIFWLYYDQEESPGKLGVAQGWSL